MSNKTITTNQIVANTTPQLIITKINYSGSNKFSLISLGANSCFIGNSTVSITTGFPISNSQYLPLEVSSNVYIICSAGTCNVAKLQIS
jgi:hypothetical protein